jgi:hypothetical protein
MMRELVIHGTTIVRTIGPAAPMPMLTICALDNVCGEGNSSTQLYLPAPSSHGLAFLRFALA